MKSLNWIDIEWRPFKSESIWDISGDTQPQSAPDTDIGLDLSHLKK